MTDTVLVLGATGTTGRCLVPRLAARGVSVRAASRRPGPGRTLFDWDRPGTHDAALAGADAVYLIPPALVEDPTPVTGPFLERARSAGVTRLVALSSQGAQFPGEHPGSGRRKLDRQVMASGLDWTILRPTGFAQNFSEGFLLPGIMQADTLVTASGEGAVAFIDADDIAAVAAAALTEDGHAKAEYTLTGPQALRFTEAAAIISEAAGRTITHRSISPGEMAHILHDAGVPADYAAMLLADMAATRNGYGGAITQTVARVTGHPPTRFADYAAHAAAARARP
jgi:uncharacterized protein YbjT (DUF2867 family)